VEVGSTEIYIKFLFTSMYVLLETNYTAYFFLNGKVADERTVDMPSRAATKSTRRVSQRHVEKKLDKTDREEPA